MTRFHQLALRLVLVAVLPGLSACAGTIDRLSQVGNPPSMTPIVNPVAKPDYQPVVLPMPMPTMEQRQANSLWSSGRKSFFKDQRAASIGDILTVLIEIDDKAQMSNESSRSRDNSEKSALNSLLGFENRLDRILPNGVAAGDLVDMSGATSNKGTGEIKRDEKIKLKVAAIITQMLPNGNLAIHGRQEVRVNFERRDLLISGVIRPEDILNDNTISYEKIAEARISYGGNGQITDVQQPRYGQQVFDIVYPF